MPARAGGEVARGAVARGAVARGGGGADRRRRGPAASRTGWTNRSQLAGKCSGTKRDPSDTDVKIAPRNLNPAPLDSGALGAGDPSCWGESCSSVS
jgi:hypothetical protein